MRYTSLISVIFGAGLLVPTVASGVELQLQVGVVPGFDSLDLESADFAGNQYNSSRELKDGDGTSVGILFGWGPSEGVGLVGGLEVAYRELEAKQPNMNKFDSTQIGVGGRLGLGVVVLDGLRLEGGGRVMVGYVETDDGIDSADGLLYMGGTINEVRESAVGVGFQAGLYVGANYRFLNNIMLGVEVGYEINRAYLATDYILHDASGDGMAAFISGGVVF